MNPTVRQFSQNIEARFLEDDSVPEELREWWSETRENLERLKDKIQELQVQNQSLSDQLGSISNQFTDAQAEQLARFVEFWEITTNGSLVPYTHSTCDIGNAERKVRDIYEDQN